MKKKLFTLVLAFVCITMSAQSLVIYNGDGANPDYTWYKSSNTDAAVQSPIPNPAKDEVNSTNNCAGFLRQKADPQYVSGGLGNLNVDITEYDKISLMVYKQLEGRVQLEIHDVNGKKYWKNTQDTDITPGKWTKLEFSLSDLTANVKVILIAPHNRNAADIVGWVDQMMYWDEVIAYNSNPTSINEGEVERNIISSELYTICGRLVKIVGLGEDLNVATDYAQGVYILKQTDDKGGVTSKKIITNK